MKKPLLALLAAGLFSVQVADAQTCVDVCPAIGVSSSFEWIQGVSIGPLFNISGNNGGYEDFGNVNATFTAGSSYSYQVGVGYGDGPFSETFSAWMDFNQDGDFEDPGEEIFTDFGQFQVSGSFFVPADAVNGKVKLRIAMGFAQANLCQNVPEGEIEDYCVNIVGGVEPACDSSEPVTGLEVFFTGNFISLVWDAVPNSVGCRVLGGQNGNFNIARNIVGSEPTFFTFQFGGLSPGDYNWKVVCGCSLDPPFDLTPDSEVSFFTVPEPETLVLNGGSIGFGDLSLSPNPTLGNLNLRFEASANGQAQISINDILGRTVMQKDLDIIEGYNTLNMDVSELPKGTYILSVVNGNSSVSTSKFIKK